MNGHVDHSGRALVKLSLRSFHNEEPSDLLVWVDTAFTGELVLPRETVEELGLQQSAAVEASLADGTEVVLETYSCLIDWHSVERQIEVIANDGKMPLMGVGLLLDRRLEIDYPNRTVVIE